MAALVAAAAALVLLGAGASALSGSDSLISLGYLTETFQPSAQKQADSAAEQILQGTYDAAVKKMDQLAQGTGTGDSRPYSGSFSSRRLLATALRLLPSFSAAASWVRPHFSIS